MLVDIVPVASSSILEAVTRLLIRWRTHDLRHVGNPSVEEDSTVSRLRCRELL